MPTKLDRSKFKLHGESEKRQYSKKYKGPVLKEHIDRVRVTEEWVEFLTDIKRRKK